MTVAELREKLSYYADDLPVVYYGEDNSNDVLISGIRIVNLFADDWDDHVHPGMALELGVK